MPSHSFFYFFEESHMEQKQTFFVLEDDTMDMDND